MANRYLRATGNWNGPVWAATSGGAAGSAATPTASDDVYIAANFTVTLTAAATAFKVGHTNGAILLNGNKLSIGPFGLSSYGTSARTLNLTNGTLEVIDTGGNNGINLSGSNLSLISTGSLVSISTYGAESGQGGLFATLGKTFNDVRINMERSGSTYSAVMNITGSPTFRSLIIQSKNSAAHTVQGNGEWQVDKFVAIGSSSSSRLTLGSIPGYLCSLKVKDLNTFSVYGQYVVPGIGIVTPSGGTLPSGYPTYIGSNSISGGYAGWLYQDPPKISTLVDPLTTAPGSNPNWTVSGTINTRTDGKDGGGYGISGTAVER